MIRLIDVKKELSINKNPVFKVLYQHPSNYTFSVIVVNQPEKIIICYPSMIGCTGRCMICRSKDKEFVCNLSNEEMTACCTQSLSVINDLFSCMGEGEPLNNSDNLLKTIHSLTELYRGKKVKFALSTSAPTKIKLRQILAKPLLKTQISTHSLIEKKRKAIIPDSITINDLMEEIEPYKNTTNLELNFVLIDNLNDTYEDAQEIIQNIGDKFLVKINKFNNFDGSGIEESGKKKSFVTYLIANKVKVEEYITDSSKLETGCGLSPAF